MPKAIFQKLGVFLYFCPSSHDKANNVRAASRISEWMGAERIRDREDEHDDRLLYPREVLNPFGARERDFHYKTKGHKEVEIRQAQNHKTRNLPLDLVLSMTTDSNYTLNFGLYRVTPGQICDFCAE